MVINFSSCLQVHQCNVCRLFPRVLSPHSFLCPEETSSSSFDQADAHKLIKVVVSCVHVGQLGRVLGSFITVTFLVSLFYNQGIRESNQTKLSLSMLYIPSSFILIDTKNQIKNGPHNLSSFLTIQQPFPYHHIDTWTRRG